MKYILIVFFVLLSAARAFCQVSEKQTGIAIGFVNHLNGNEIARAYVLFDSTVIRHVSEQQLAELWQMIQKQVGNFKEIFAVTTEEVDTIDFVYVSCGFERMDLDIKISFFDTRDKIAGFFLVPSTARVKYTLPSYADSSLFREQDIVVTTGGFELPGTLSLPRGDGPFPAIILVHGSGPNDRDESVGLSKPFRDLALGLASRGIAVIRYEKRTRAVPNKLDVNRLTLYEETVEDAVNAVHLAKSIGQIDPHRVFVLGHSLGGYAIPLIVSHLSGVGGAIMLAASARPLEDLLVMQTRYILSLDSLTTEGEKTIKTIARQAARVKTLTPEDDTPADSLPMGVSASYWYYLNRYDHLKMARKMKCPVLILQGERDYQVTLDDYNIWKETIGHRRKVTMKTYAGLNHLFIHGEGIVKPDEYMKPGHLEEEVITDIERWITMAGKRKK